MCKRRGVLIEGIWHPRDVAIDEFTLGATGGVVGGEGGEVDGDEIKTDL